MSNAKTWKRTAGGAGLVAAGLVAGGILAGTLSANAADTGTTTSPESSSSAPVDPSQPQRSDETLLTGTTADRVRAAALAKYPGASVQRVETDSDGVYEAHIVSGGKQLIVQVGKDYTVTGTQTMGPGMGAGMGGAPAPGGTTSSG